MEIIDGIPVWNKLEVAEELGERDEAFDQIKMVARTADQVALMADYHKGYSAPVGAVIGYEDAVSPSGVGYDISCGNKAVKTNMREEDLRKDIDPIMDLIWGNLSFGMGLNNSKMVEHELFDDPAWKMRAVGPLKEMARKQLGTIGSGNHYVDLFADEDGWVWIGVHFGSRGFGHKTATFFLKAGGAKGGMDAKPLVLNTAGELGADYITCMQLAGRYAYAGRDWVCKEVARLLQVETSEEIHNHHNYAWRKGKMWVVRKGATPNHPGQRGFVGGSMGDNAVIIEGKWSPTSELSMFSTVHGAGRVMSRTAAKKTITPKEMHDWLQAKGVTLRGAGLDEAPQAYKRLDEVLPHHADSVNILHVLRPVGVAMAGADIDDPFKD